jgi:hypothetical protein
MLLAKGANVNGVSRPVMGLSSRNSPSEFGNLTAFLMAAPFGLPDLIKTLLDARAAVRPSLERTLALSEKSSVEFFAKSGCVACHVNVGTHLR